MDTTIGIQSLNRYETSNDGTSISLIGKDTSGEIVTLTFPADCLSSLLMTLPTLVNAAVQQRTNDPSVRVVYPLAKYKIELAKDRSTRIMTLQTPDEFAVSFAIRQDQVQMFATAMIDP